MRKLIDLLLPPSVLYQFPVAWVSGKLGAYDVEYRQKGSTDTEKSVLAQAKHLNHEKVNRLVLTFHTLSTSKLNGLMRRWVDETMG